MNFFKQLHNEQGVTLVEALLGMTIMVGAATLGMRVMENLQTQTKMVEKNSAIMSLMSEISTHVQSKNVCSSNLTSAFTGSGAAYSTSGSFTVGGQLSASIPILYGVQGRIVAQQGSTIGTQELFDIEDISILLNQISAATDAAYTHSAQGIIRLTFSTCKKGLTNCDASKKITRTKSVTIPNVNVVSSAGSFTFECSSGQDGLLDQASTDTDEKLDKVLCAVNTSFNSMNQQLNESNEKFCDFKANYMIENNQSGSVDSSLCGTMSVYYSSSGTSPYFLKLNHSYVAVDAGSITVDGYGEDCPDTSTVADSGYTTSGSSSTSSTTASTSTDYTTSGSIDSVSLAEADKVAEVLDVAYEGSGDTTTTVKIPDTIEPIAPIEEVIKEPIVEVTEVAVKEMPTKAQGGGKTSTPVIDTKPSSVKFKKK
jgi:hypothetical protein